MADVLFLSPPRRHDGSRALFNNASLTLASYLARHGLDARVEPLSGAHWRADLASALERHQPRVAAVSCKWWDTLFGATEVAREIRKVRPDTPVVAGGQTATAFAGDLVAGGYFDAVICGDGEKPLLDYARGKPEGNLVFASGGHVTRLPHTYVQPRGGTEDLSLVADLAAVADERFLRYVGYGAPFIWTGKGCQSTCLFCGGSALGHKSLFGRTGYAYRPFEQVLHDMEVLGRWSGGTFMFDFDPVTDPSKREYYRELFEHLPKKRYHVAFYCWSLPDDAFIDMLAATFRSCVIGIDAQTYSEPLRARLAKTAWIKPFASDDALTHALEVCRSNSNCAVAMYGIVGLATETADDVRRSEDWIGHLLDAYGDVFYELQTTPLSIEPGALMAHNPDKYGMTALRRTFEDYYEFTRLQYFRDAGFHEAPYDPALPHPYGVHQTQDAPDRVWHDFHRIQKHIDERILEIHNRQAVDSLRIEEDRVHLTLRNRTAYQDVWRLVPWAAQEALGRAIPLVEIDASHAWINVPHRDAIAADERLAWMSGQLEVIGEAIRSGRVALRLPDAPEHQWGALEAACLV